MLVKSFELGKAIKIDNIPQIFFDGYFSGFCRCIQFFDSCSIKLEMAGGSVSVRSFGSFDVSYYAGLTPGNFDATPKESMRAVYQQLDLDLSGFS